MSKKHKSHSHGIKLFSTKDLQAINEFRATREMNDHSNAQAASMMAAFFLIFACAAAYLLPENFLGYNNFNGNCAVAFIVMAAIFAIISKIIGFHIDPTTKYVHDENEE